MDLAFDHPNLLHLLWLTPTMVLIYVYGFTQKRNAIHRFATANLLTTLIPRISTARQKVKAVTIILATVALIFALTGPRWGKHWEELERKGVDIIFVLDVSNSMLAEDVVPSRLERAKLDVIDLLSILPGDRVGLVTFAGQASVACPLTINYSAFRIAMQNVNTRSSARGGTQIGDAIRLAAASFTDKIRDHKAIIVISDGEETDDSYAVEAAQNTYDEKGIRVFTVGMGNANEGGRIPIQRGGQRVYLTHEGQEVWTKLHPQMLQDIAFSADGGYFANTDFRQVYDRIADKIEQRTYESQRKELRYARFHWFAALALSLLMIETLMTDRRTTS